MKKNLFLSIVLSGLSGLSLFAADNIKTINPKITHVTVFPSSAQLTSSADISLAQGTNTLILQGLSPYIDKQSLQVKGKGKFMVLSAGFQENIITGLQDNVEIEVLKKKIEDITGKIEEEKLQTGILKEEESFLISNKEVGGKNESMDAANFKLLFDFYKTSLSQVRTEIYNRGIKIRDLEKEQSKLKAQLQALQTGSNLSSNQLTLVLKADAACTGSIEINYLVQAAGWYPSYDIRVNKLSEPVSLIYKANVYQNTGVPWENVNLSFSNANPSLGGNVPILYPWYLNFYVPNTYSYQKMDKKSAPAVMAESAIMEDSDIRGMASIPVGFTSSSNTTSLEFQVDLPYSIPNGGEAKSIDMMHIELPASFRYQAVPKSEKAAFLIARISDWQQYDLLDGEANLYFENTYVGKSQLSIQMISDTLDISLGRDMGIVLKREKRKDYTSEKFIGPNKVVARSWEITVKNNKKEAVKMQLSDQVPVSQNKDITVEITELSGGKINAPTGIVTWDINLDAGQSKTLIISYTVKFPKDSNVLLE
ncbi:MAG: mucoidy inhibitor MuiA family protein [Bacteroidales bacterium]|nr:mucoidy inhibitor MuiA family protein [Bacteroidales bacterium]MCB8998613.1 mucoidy inhibitor MuiA family protein [Bacteroidales bacterium]MCB9012519.1 mucoidy inhibitor MuiA family protein [Bacteroidales bacterium]